MERRAQSAIELMILIGAVFFFFILFLGSLQSQSGEKAHEKRNNIIKEIALTVQDEVNLAVSSSDGYSRTFKLSLDALNVDYDISIEDDFVYARTTNGKHAIALPIANVTGQPQKGDNLIRKTNGRIFLNE